MLDCVALQVAVKCEGCDAAVPVNGPLQSVTCTRCGEVARLEGRLRWSEVLNFMNPHVTVFAFAVRQQPGAVERGAWQPVKLNSARRWPDCANCKVGFEPSVILGAVARRPAQPVVFCGHCGTGLPFAVAPDFFRAQFPCAWYVVGADLPEATPSARSAPGGSKPVVMTCMSCSAPLPVDGSVRLVECQFCNVGNYLPDDLWFTLHPAARRESWCVLFDPRLATS